MVTRNRSGYGDSKYNYPAVAFAASLISQWNDLKQRGARLSE